MMSTITNFGILWGSLFNCRVPPITSEEKMKDYIQSQVIVDAMESTVEITNKGENETKPSDDLSKFQHSNVFLAFSLLVNVP